MNELANAAPPKRLLVIERLRELLQTISHENGYNVDIGRRVSLGVAEFGDNMVTPFLSILESPTADIGDFANAESARLEEWTLLLQGWIDSQFFYEGSDLDNPTRNAYYLAADVEKCLARVTGINKKFGSPLDPAWYHLGGVINGMSIAPPVVRPPDTNSPKAWFYMPVRIEMSVNLNNPYTI